ncbi:hypothetical protein F5888DRAFT_1645560 [Russula emetica]|nr:hypothetical protein F5888DRAFT_1645560 [Russula emetica]
MSDDTLKIKRRLSTLTSSLDDLETSLTPLLSQSLPDLVIGLDTIQQAKLQVVIPYLVYDLVFVYLKTRGLDPKTHTVIAELDRVRQYFDKIKDAEDPAKRQLAIDKAAATRFIKNAIAQANDTRPANASNTDPATTTHTHFGDESGNGKTNDKAHDVPVPAKITEKMLEREKYHEALREETQLASDEDGEHLEIIDNDDGDEEEERDEGKANATVASPIPIPDDVPPPSSAAARKRRRPPIDPFAGLCGSLISSCFSSVLP